MDYQLDIAHVKSFLANSVLFQGADDNGLELIANQLEYLRLKKGDPIVIENEVSDHVYFIYSGSAEVVKHIPELNKMSRVAVLSKGSQFSEFSVLIRSRKGASVFAMEDCEILRMSGPAFMQVLSQLPEVAKSLAIHIAKMTRHQQLSKFRFQYVKDNQVVPHPRIPQIFPQQLWQKFRALPLSLDGTGLYLATREPENRELYEDLKSSQPQIRVKVQLINEDDFISLSKQLMEVYRGQNIPLPEKQVVAEPLTGDAATWMKQVSVFQDMPDEWIAQIAPHFMYRTVAAGQSVYEQGHPSDHMFVLLSGIVDVALPLKIGNGEVHLGEKTPGEYFAEISILNNEKHSLNVRAKTEVKLAYLSKEAFYNIMQTPVFTLPLARDMAMQFKRSTEGETFQMFDPNGGVQVEELAALIPKTILARYEILPLRLEDNEITVGTTNPESETIYSVISRYLHQYRVRLQIIPQSDFKKWFALVDKSVEGAASVVGRQGSVNAVKTNPVQALNEILLYGYEHRASDLHIEPQNDSFVVRYRIDGVLREYPSKYSLQVGEEMVNRIKILSKMDVTNRMTPQDGQLNMEHDGRTFVARTSTLPTKHGENAVLRLIRERSSVPPLATLAADLRVVNAFRQVVASRQGVFLVTGPTGSGKSTTLYSLLEELNKVEINIISLENPVELTVAGTTQVEVNEKTGLTFAAALKCALRQDPDVIMIGEIRDEESAKIAFHAAATGHLVISTLHTNDSLSVVPRLLEMGVTRQAIASTLLGASAQRLARKVCSKCQAERPITQAELELLKREVPYITPPENMSFGAGCNACDHSGFHGRVPIMEIWKKTKFIENALLEGRPIEAAVLDDPQLKFETLRQFALRMACAGLTTIEEVESNFGGLLGNAA